MSLTRIIKFSLMLLLILIAFACARSSMRVVENIFSDDKPFFQCGFDDSITGVHLPIVPDNTINIADNSLRICRWNGEKVVPYWITPIQIETDSAGFLTQDGGVTLNHDIEVTIVDQSGIIVNVVSFDFTSEYGPKLTPAETHVVESSNGRVAVEYLGNFYVLGEDVKRREDRMAFSRSNPSLRGFYHMYGSSWGYQFEYDGLLLRSQNNGIVHFNEVCGNTQLESGYFVDFGNDPLRESDFLSPAYSAFYWRPNRQMFVRRIRGTEIEYFDYFRVPPPRGEDADIPELSGLIRQALFRQDNQSLGEWIKDFVWEGKIVNNMSFENLTLGLRNSDVLASIWNTIKVLGIDWVISPDEVYEPQLLISGDAFRGSSRYSGISYMEFAKNLIHCYQNPDNECEPYYTEFWQRRKAEHLDKITFKILVEFVQNYEPHAYDEVVISGKASDPLQKCIEFENTLRNTEFAAERINHLTAYVEYLISINMYASASALVNFGYREYGIETLPEEVIALTTGPHFQATASKANFNRQWVNDRLESSYAMGLSCDHGP